MVLTKRTQQKPDLSPSELKRYKNRIKYLAMQTLIGDMEAENTLNQELNNSPLARKIVGNIIKKRQKYVQRPGETGVRGGRHKPTYGSPCRPYQGGSPGLGKRA